MVIAGIVAGGSGTRMGGNIPKQFYELNGKPVLIYTAERFLNHGGINAVIIGINPEWEEYARELINKHLPCCKNIFLTNGGSDRNETVSLIIRFAQRVLGCAENDVILTHDAVRPFVTSRIISDCIEAMSSCDICTAVIPETDTVVVSKDGGYAESFPDRSSVFRVQTPQALRIGSFNSVYETLSANEKKLATDVCRLYSSNGYNVKLIDGDITNIKLTYPHDYSFAEFLAKQ